MVYFSFIWLILKIGLNSYLEGCQGPVLDIFFFREGNSKVQGMNHAQILILVDMIEGGNVPTFAQ